MTVQRDEVKGLVDAHVAELRRRTRAAVDEAEAEAQRSSNGACLPYATPQKGWRSCTDAAPIGKMKQTGGDPREPVVRELVI